METMEEQRKRPRRSFSDEYKAEVVELAVLPTDVVNAKYPLMK